MHILLFDKEKHEFVILYKVITLNVQGKCTNYTRGFGAGPICLCRNIVSLCRDIVSLCRDIVVSFFGF